MRKLIIIRGVSGSGKTTFAKLLVTAFESMGLTALNCAADDYFYDENGNYNFNVLELDKAHSWCKGCVEVTMSGGTNVVIVSNTSTAKWEYEPYVALAEKYGYTVDCIVKENLHAGVSVHSVPEGVLNRQRDRLKSNLSL